MRMTIYFVMVLETALLISNRRTLYVIPTNLGEIRNLIKAGLIS
ncbi:hypothetical protein THF1C08_10306 [Vibrio jasicida]|uniref:Uncharacterized protein n=1 Tax=Vibrio jasicida TaxID=766224 RepID=A0AAU9QE42_9VIBR|nr:hypothetical protein THF1C08_10306 [Vibrio jasicida]CAH1564760.1 hypothetical protein THF1A12_10307 [Vibrio jasicida]